MTMSKQGKESKQKLANDLLKNVMRKETALITQKFGLKQEENGSQISEEIEDSESDGGLEEDVSNEGSQGGEDNNTKKDDEAVVVKNVLPSLP